MKRRIIIGIAGGSGSGKTTLANNIAAHFGDRIAMLRHDDYYKKNTNLPLEERAKINYDHPSAFDTELLLEHLDALKNGSPVNCPIYDYSMHDRGQDIRIVEPADVIILEGILIFENKELRDLMDIKVFVDTDADIRLSRRILRDVKERGRSMESVITQYTTTVKPMHEEFVEPSKKYADVIIPEGGFNSVAVSMIIENIKSLINR